MNELQTIDQSASTNAMIFDPAKLQAMQVMAKAMSEAAIAVPAHFRGKPGDCLAVVMQAMQWGMNPFSVSQKTHISQGGALGYESQLINAVIVSVGAVDGQPEFEFIGNWNKILGKVEERKSDKGGKYYVATYNKSDEDGLGVVCRARLRGEQNPREITVMMSQCYPRFSTQWATDPQQQITYVAVRKFARRYAPGAILGVYTVEELDYPVERDITAEGRVVSSEPAAPIFYSQADFDKNFPAWCKSINSGKRTPEDIIAIVSSKAQLTAEQIAAIKDCAPIDVGGMTFAEVSDALNHAGDVETLDLKADLIRQVEDETQQAELTGMYRTLRAELEG